MRGAPALSAVVILLFLAPAMPAAPIAGLPPLLEIAVEGHTVYAIVEQPASGTLSPAPGPASVSTLPPTPSLWPTPASAARWFNDQDLVTVDQVGPAGSAWAAVAVLVREQGAGGTVRYPCTGAVIVANAGDYVPYDLPPWWTPVVPSSAAYVHSYRVTDPNDRQWTIDLWDARFYPTDPPLWLWSVPLGNNAAGASVPDDGTSYCPAFAEVSPAKEVGDNGIPYPGTPGPSTPPLTATRGDFRYNALVLLPLARLADAGMHKAHGNGSWDRLADGPGCHEATCPSGDEWREGNSHDHNRWSDLSSRDPAHGAACPDPSLPRACHTMHFVDVYYGAVLATPPAVRTYVVSDAIGKAGSY